MTDASRWDFKLRQDAPTQNSSPSGRGIAEAASTAQVRGQEKACAPQSGPCLSLQSRKVFVSQTLLKSFTQASMTLDPHQLKSETSVSTIDLPSFGEVPLRVARALEGQFLMVHDSELTSSLLSQIEQIPQIIWVAIVPLDITESRARLLFDFGAADLIPTQFVEEQASGLFRAKIGRWISATEMSHSSDLSSVHDQAIKPLLTRKESQLYELIQRSGSEGIEKTLLVDLLWPGLKVSEKSLDVHLFNLRRKLSGTPLRAICRDRRIYLERVEISPGPVSS